MVTIDKLAPDLLSSTQQQIGPVFPDSFVEGVLLFKRSGLYYLIYSSCCCCCTAGAGATVYSASDIAGPWTRQSKDVNCHADVPICAGMPDHEHPDRPTGQLIIPAQGFNVARLRGAGGSDADKDAVYIWTGERWLSGAHAPNSTCIGDSTSNLLCACRESVNVEPLLPQGRVVLALLFTDYLQTHTCIVRNPSTYHHHDPLDFLAFLGRYVLLTDWLRRRHDTGDCAPATGVCARDPRFRKGHEFTYWAPLAFDADGSIQTFKAFQDSVTIEVA